MKKILLLLVVLLGISTAFGQVVNPVKWSVKAVDSRAEFTAIIDHPWHIYDLGPYAEGPNATTFTYTLPAGVVLDGKMTTSIQPKKSYDDIFEMQIGYFANKVTFVQKFARGGASSSASPGAGKSVAIVANVEWQACDESSCLPPNDHEFKFNVVLPAGAATSAANANAIGDGATMSSDSAAMAVGAVLSSDSSGAAAAVSTEVTDSEIKNEQKSLWSVIIEAILWGFAALLTPCVFPMVPMTVSFFMKGNGSKSRGRFMAGFYGLSIVLLYTLPIAVIILTTWVLGGDAVTADIFNWLATHWVPNILFFLIFMIFAASFFGAFEITMPSKLVNKTDSQADKGGLLGVFFMAMTLVLVSFSCTGPIVGTILVKSTQGEIWEPIITMVAFSTAFALPFTLFAFFPSLLKNLPKSGGWLNSVKVVLGFIELALGLKFLSVADQTYHWGLLDREVYIALWVVIFTLMGFYLLGKIRFAHDSETKFVKVKSLFFSIITFAFVVYMIPGMFGAPLKALSGYLPPMSTLDFNLSVVPGGGAGSGVSSGSALDLTKIKGGKPKYSDFLHLPHGLEGFFDLQEGMEYAKAVGKPVFLDFTGHGCVNCREMEANVWSDPAVRSILQKDYVIIALYVDDKKTLPESEWVTTKDGKVQKTLGKINATYQIERFNINAQPYYVLMNNDGELLTPPRSYNLDVAGFIQFLEKGLAAYAAQGSAVAGR